VDRIQRHGGPCLTIAQALLLLKDWWSNVSGIPPGSVNRIAEFELLGELNAEVLEAAFCQLVARHELLRTAILGTTSSFPSTSPLIVQQLRCAAAEGNTLRDLHRMGLLDPRRGLLSPNIFRQDIKPNVRITIENIDLSQLPLTSQFAEAKRIANALVRVPCDLSKPPLLRVTLLRLKSNHHQLLIAGSPVAFDAEALDVLFRELEVLYRSLSAGVPSPLLELPIQFSDFARWEWDHLSGDTLDNLLTFWREKWSRPTLEPFLLSNTGSGGESVRTASLSAVIDRNLLFELRRLAERQHITDFMLFCLALILILHAYNRREHITILIVLTNRTTPEALSLIGRFSNTNVLNVSLSPDMSIANVAREVRDAVSAAVEHQELPVPELWLGTETPNVPITFRMVRHRVSHWAPGLVARRIILHDAPPLNTMDVLVHQFPDSATVVIRGYPDRLSEVFFDSVATDYDNLLRALIAESAWSSVTVRQLVGMAIGRTG
jgi:hypothetical protein